MGSYINYKAFDHAQQNNGGDGSGAPNPLGNFTLTQQPSVYSLTFDEFQNTLCGSGKDFGSMNMDELLRNIWTAEETQAMATTTTPSTSLGPEAIFNGSNLQRQGSLTLPRTLSQKTVDEVWRELSKESGGDTNKPNNEEKRSLPQKEPTLGEITLEEFLARAGIVREETQQAERPNNTGFFGELVRENNTNNTTNLAFGFQQRSQNDVALDNNKISLNVGGVRSSLPQQLPALPPAQLPLFPKPATVAFAPMKSGLAPSEGLPPGAVGMVGLSTNGVTVAARPGVNPVSSGLIAKSSVDASSLSPVPYVFSRGRRCGAVLEKVVERRQRRMIKNRESAARSRARKQAYTLELEEEVAKLKEMNHELQKKQEEIMEMQKNQLLEKMKFQLGGKRQCLRRTLTGPW